MPVNDTQAQEIASLREDMQPTRREVAPALEEVLYEAIPLLDHGFIRVIDYMGTDSAIVQAARVSYGKGTKKINEDAGLLNYLLRHRHTTPFEMCEIKFHVKMPMFVARQWIRHRTANVNEYSARYSIMDREFYVPQPQHLAAQSRTNRQGRADVLEGEEAARALEWLKEDASRAYDHYETMLNEDAAGNILDESKQGLARELARMNLPVNFYTQWYWKIDLHNLLHFLSLRADSHAQYEIRVYAQAMLDLVKRWVPITYDAFERYRLGAVSFSAPGMVALKRMLAGENVTQEDSGMSKGEWREFMESLGRSA